MCLNCFSSLSVDASPQPECQVAEPALNQKEEVMKECRPPAPAVHSRPAPYWICPVSFIEFSKTTFPSPLIVSSMDVFKTFLLFGEVEVGLAAKSCFLSLIRGLLLFSFNVIPEWFIILTILVLHIFVHQE